MNNNRNKIAAATLGSLLAGAALLGASPAQAVNSDTVALFTAAVNAEAAKYHTYPIEVYVDTLDEPNAVAGTDGTDIVINSNYARLTPAQFDFSIADDIARGYHPSGCGGIATAAIHEVGHILDHRSGLVTRQAVRQADYDGRLGDDLHGYAFDGGVLSPGEAVAVSFQAVECGSATPTERSIYNLLIS